jgi:hypothetical protein
MPEDDHVEYGRNTGETDALFSSRYHIFQAQQSLTSPTDDDTNAFNEECL